MSDWSRRNAICAGAAAAGVLAIGEVASAAAGAKPAMTTYRNPDCNCCGKWAGLARAAGYPVTMIPNGQMTAVKSKLGVPDALASCHTSRIGGYVVEGHVPFAVVDKLVRRKPKGVTGIAVPGMPAGSPGLEVHGGHGDSAAIKVFAFNRAGQRSEFRF